MLFCSEFDVAAAALRDPSALYRRLPPRSENHSGGTPSWVQGAEPLGLAFVEINEPLTL